MACSIGLFGCGSARAEAPDAPAAYSLPPITADAVRPHVEYLASPKLEGRGTAAGKQLAVDYLIRQFEELRLVPLFDGSFVQEVPGSRSAQGNRKVLGRNVGALLPGSDPSRRDEFVILSAHYDHLGIGKDGSVFCGADDNAGSVAMMLEVARAFVRSDAKPRRSLVFLSCDLEEKLLWGARWFAAHPPWPLERVKLFITAEMIGRTLGDLPMKTVFVLGAERGTGLKDLVNGVRLPPGLEIAHLGVDIIGTRSDYGPFQSEKVPFLFFSGGEHPDYHSPRDTADRVDYQRVARVAGLIAGVCRAAADSDATPQWTDSPRHELDEVRTLFQVTDLALKTDAAAEAAGKKHLDQKQRFALTNMHSRTSQILERGTIDPAERGWLVRAAQVLLLTVF